MRKIFGLAALIIFVVPGIQSSSYTQEEIRCE